MVVLMTPAAEIGGWQLSALSKAESQTLDASIFKGSEQSLAAPHSR
jgi:hypothetical protein